VHHAGRQPVTTLDEENCWRSKRLAGGQPVAALDEGDEVSRMSIRAPWEATLIPHLIRKPVETIHKQNNKRSKKDSFSITPHNCRQIIDSPNMAPTQRGVKKGQVRRQN
jgi:hypothetical protein